MAYEKIKQNVMAICSSLYLNCNYKVIPPSLMFQWVGNFAFYFQIYQSFKNKITFTLMFSRLWILHTSKSHYIKERYNLGEKKSPWSVVEARIIPLIVDTFMRWHSSRNNCRKQSSPKSFDTGAKYTWFANQNSGFFGPKCHLSGLCSHRLMGAAPSLCRAVLLVPWSATPLLGSSQCLCQKPVGVETCQNVNLEVYALLMGNAERHVLNIYNPNHDVFTRQP